MQIERLETYKDENLRQTQYQKIRQNKSPVGSAKLNNQE